VFTHSRIVLGKSYRSLFHKQFALIQLQSVIISCYMLHRLHVWISAWLT